MITFLLMFPLRPVTLLLLFLISFSGSGRLFCQVTPPLFNPARAGTWYFGLFSGLSFQNGTVSQRSDCPVNFGECNGTTMCDLSGNPLFYVSAPEIFSANHTLMNGSPQPTVTYSTHSHPYTIPRPGSPDQYYVFWLRHNWDANMQVQNHLEYVTLDMSANGGLGTLLHAPVALDSNLSFVFTVIQHCDEESVWLVYYHLPTRSFRSKRVDFSGPQTGFIVSDPGFFINGSAICFSNLRASPDGKLLIIPRNELTYVSTSAPRCALARFDTRTGKVGQHVNFGRVYEGACFSPDNSRIYLACPDGHLYQYSVAGFSQTALQNSEVDLYQNPVAAVRLWRRVQNGPDGKLYLSSFNNDDVGVINFPNLPDFACNLIPDQIEMGVNNNGINMFANSLLNLPQYYFDQTRGSVLTEPLAIHLEAQGFCTGEKIRFFATPDSAIYSFEWDFDDQSSGTDNHASGIRSAHAFSQPGEYTVTLIVENACKTARDTLREVVSIQDCQLQMPNVFSPNADGVNDVFRPFDLENIAAYRLEIYNRWGKQLWVSENPQTGWDGGGAGDGVYYYRLKYSHRFGHLETPQNQAGSFTLMR